MQTALDFLPTLVLKDILNEKQTKTKMGMGIMLIKMFALKVIILKENFQRIMKSIIVEKVVPVVTQVVQRNKIVDSSELTAAKFLIYFFL